MRAMSVTERAAPMRALIECTLPGRLVGEGRQQLAALLALHITVWVESEKLIKDGEDRRRLLIPEVRKLQARLQKTNALLKRLGLERGLAEVKAVPQPSEEVELYKITTKALDELGQWESRYRGSAHAPKSRRTELVEKLRDACRQFSAKEFGDLLARIGGHNGVPKLSAAGLKKRRARAKRSETN